MLAINIFALPIALAGQLRFPSGGVDADTFVLTLPMAERQSGLALLAFIGGMSAATGMVIVETIALSTMVCNDLVMPVLLRRRRLGRHDPALELKRNGSALIVDVAWLFCLKVGSHATSTLDRLRAAADGGS